MVLAKAVYREIIKYITNNSVWGDCYRRQKPRSKRYNNDLAVNNHLNINNYNNITHNLFKILAIPVNSLMMRIGIIST